MAFSTICMSQTCMQVSYNMTSKAGINVIYWGCPTLKVTGQALVLGAVRMIINQQALIIRMFMTGYTFEGLYITCLWGSIMTMHTIEMVTVVIMQPACIMCMTI